MVSGDHRLHVPPEHLPSATVVVKSKNSDQTLYVVVDERVIELGVSFLQCFCNNTVIREEFEVDACGGAKSSRVDAEPAEVTHDESQRLASG